MSDERNETRAVTERRRKQGGRLRPDPGELSERKAAIVTNVRRKGAALLSHRSPPPFVTRSVRSLHVPSPYSFLPEGLSEEGNPRHEAPTRKGGGRYEKRPIRTEGSRRRETKHQTRRVTRRSIISQFLPFVTHPHPIPHVSPAPPRPPGGSETRGNGRGWRSDEE